MKHICVFIISFWVFSVACGQNSPTADTDSIPPRVEKFGIRAGVNLYAPARTLFDNNYSGYEVMGDIRVYKRYYLAVEIGNEQKNTSDSNISSQGSGTYFKTGFDYNAHKNWGNLNNMIFGGLRYGISTFDQTILSYSIAHNEPWFGDDIREVNLHYSGLSAQWIELVVGVKTEILNNLFLSLNLQLKRLINQKQPDNFENLYIPGFGRTYEGSRFGAGFGYGISYLIPIYKK